MPPRPARMPVSPRPPPPQGLPYASRCLPLLRGQDALAGQPSITNLFHRDPDGGEVGVWVRASGVADRLPDEQQNLNLVLGGGFDRRVDDATVRRDLVVDQYLTTPRTGLCVLILEIIGRAVENVG